MMAEKRPRFRLSIRTKALLLLPLLLSIPYAGYQYVREMEDFLRQGLQSSVLGSARALAGALHDQPALFESARAFDAGSTVLYVHPLSAALEVDGYAEEWTAYLPERRSLPHYPRRGAPGDLDAHYTAGKHDNYLYLMVSVDDEHIVYRESNVAPPYASDLVQVDIENPHGARKQLVLAPLSPGWVTAYELGSDVDEAPYKVEGRIRAAWQETSKGYLLEARLPLDMVGARAALTILDIDAPEVETVRRRIEPPLWPVILPSSEIENLIARLGRMEGSRVWVIDSRGHILARGGTLRRELPPISINPLYGLILRPPSMDRLDERPVRSRLAGPEIVAALTGNPNSRWRRSESRDSWIVSAAHPIWAQDTVVGAVLVEESTVGIQTLTREALANLFNTTLTVCVVGALVLLMFASRIALRLRRLRDEAEQAIDEHGRLTGKLLRSHGVDEIGDLSRSMVAMMDRLKKYNEYLENLARRLSHELRTPIAIVRSSLETLQLEPSADAVPKYSERAREGLNRLDQIIARMGEATRLEQAIAQAEPETFDLGHVLQTTVEAYRSAWPDRTFNFACAAGKPAPMNGVPELIVQLLDKLVSNAVELGDPAFPVAIELHEEKHHYHLRVINFGSRLPDDMQDSLFESMVSVRTRGADATPHLGLGLYIARLIAEFHGGNIHATNEPERNRVAFVVELPRPGIL